jgi:ketose-bisphosphate aldolase
MPIVPVREMLRDAARRCYAVGYFESWDMESLLAAADAAREMQSPVLLGFSGIYLPHRERIRHDPLEVFAAMGLAVCRSLSVPVNLVFNESPDENWVKEAIRCGFGQVMFTDDRLEYDALLQQVKQIVLEAHLNWVAVEGELTPVPGLAGSLQREPEDFRLTDPVAAKRFVEATGIDILAINIGQAHLHGRQEVSLDFKRLAEIRKTIGIPLVLHGASSINKGDLRIAVENGITKVNVGSRLKQAYFSAIREQLDSIGESHNPYEVIGSGLEQDILVNSRLAMTRVIEEYMEVLGSAGKA